ncbi:MAG: adenosylcobinamide-GDP ribazoletransferase [Armatimonadetes bacterium]|nr:adenosylcobinamide-GDP ribazoletransferase [Armatimonadota bacterium]
MGRGLVTALRTLTLLPVPGREAASVATALYWFPLVGLLIGLLQWGAGGLVNALAVKGWPAGAAAAALAASAALTRGLHLDGLADWADASVVLAGRERALEVMKDPRIGALGAVALVSVLLGKWVALMRLATAGGLVWVLPACVIARAMQVELAATLPYARAEGGTAGSFVEGAGAAHRVVVLGAAALLVLVPFGGLGGAALLLAWLAARLFAWRCRVRFGGVTGDVLGAGSELTELLVLIVAALAADPAAGVRTVGWAGWF